MIQSIPLLVLVLPSQAFLHIIWEFICQLKNDLNVYFGSLVSNIMSQSPCQNLGQKKERIIFPKILFFMMFCYGMWYDWDHLLYHIVLETKPYLPVQNNPICGCHIVIWYLWCWTISVCWLNKSHVGLWILNLSFLLPWKAEIPEYFCFALHPRKGTIQIREVHRFSETMK